MKVGSLEVHGVIYKITNEVNGKVYIGQTTRGFYKRYPSSGEDIIRVYKYHNSLKNKKLYYNKHLLDSINKYGFKSFSVDKCLDIAFSQKELNAKEKSWILIYNSFKDGYNQNEGGEIITRNIGEANYFYGKRFTKENNGFYKKKHSKETRLRMSKNHANVSGKNNPMYGMKHSQETKDKISRSRKGWVSPLKGIPQPHNAGKNNPVSRPCRITFKDGKILNFDCVTQLIKCFEGEISSTQIKTILKSNKPYIPRQKRLKKFENCIITYC